MNKNRYAENGPRIDQLIAAMKTHFGSDEKRIQHALRVLDYAREILKEEGGSSPFIVQAASVLHDIGIPEAEARHQSSGGTIKKSMDHQSPKRLWKNVMLKRTQWTIL